MNATFSHKYRLTLLLFVSAAIRLFLAAFIELGNDEVYYINYALYPDLSHFDHPPMVGWFIQLFSLNLLFDSEAFIRLGAIVAGTLNTWLIYLIGKQLKDGLTGWYAALLYTASIYCFIIAGIFMMPDAPQTLFWLGSIYFMIRLIKAGPESREGGKFMLLTGISAGLALLSKYTSIFLFSGLGFYILFFDRKWLRKWQTYAALFISFLLFLPVIIWNIRHDFISFSFHTERVEVVQTLLRPDLFAIELGGQIFYSNPFVFGLMVAGLIAFWKGRFRQSRAEVRLLIAISIPMILLFLAFSLFRRTLPHWTGPAYMTLIPLAALFLRSLTLKGREGKWFPPMIKSAIGFLILLITVALLQFSQGWFLNKGINPQTGKRLGIKDITLDMYGWEQLHDGFKPVYEQDTTSGRMSKEAVIIQQRWFPAANLDYYVARPLGITLLTLADLERTHKYAWITQYRGGFHLGMDAYYFSSSYEFSDPNGLYAEYFTSIEPPDTIPVYRNGLLVEYHYVWRMKGMRKIYLR
ncbi:MAG: glycosyltransferase family 39 protein [Lentimicrobiaceae bacterium]|nr:glycosyltransferase family 39 protein [Lentimicrobiaceae bacterium]